MPTPRLERWLQNIYHTQDEEMPCSEGLDLVSHFLQVELSGKDAAIKMPGLRQYLDQCTACWEEKECRLPSLDDRQVLIL